MHRISRRLFLHESLLAAGAAAAVPAILQAADQPKQSKSPSERLSIAVLGVNGRGSDHIKAYNERSDCFMKSVAEILKEIRPEFDFTASDDFIAEGMLDSFDVVTLVSVLDRTYGISIDGVDIVPENFKNVQTIEALLRKNGVTP